MITSSSPKIRVFLNLRLKLEKKIFKTLSPLTEQRWIIQRTWTDSPLK